MNKEYIENLVRKDIQSLGCVIWGIELLGSSTNPILRVFIDNDAGVSIEDCEKVSRHISKVLQANDVCSNNLNLEVSSPGIERKFFNKDQYLDFLGRIIKVRYKDHNKEYKTVKGKLLKVSKGNLVVEVRDNKFSINLESIEKANLEFSGVIDAK